MLEVALATNTIEAPMHMIEGYKASFHPNVEKVIRQLVGTKFCINLFSGSSTIGNIRVDIENKHATNNENVYNFIQNYEMPKTDGETILVMDPDYNIKRAELKLKPHGIKESLAGNVLAHKLLYGFIDRCKFDHIVLLDYCSPEFANYSEMWFWRVKYQGWVHNRTLTWYIRKNYDLDTFQT